MLKIFFLLRLPVRSYDRSETCFKTLHVNYASRLWWSQTKLLRLRSQRKAKWPSLQVKSMWWVFLVSVEELCIGNGVVRMITFWESQELTKCQGKILVWENCFFLFQAWSCQCLVGWSFWGSSKCLYILYSYILVQMIVEFFRNFCAHLEWKCAETVGTVLVPSAGHFQC